MKTSGVVAWIKRYMTVFNGQEWRLLNLSHRRHSHLQHNHRVME